MPLAAKARDQRSSDVEDAERDDDPRGDAVARFFASSEPIAVALRPSRMKIVEKLAMKSRLGASTRRQPARSNSAGVTPTTVDR